jgi:hypothetical protein
MTTPLQSAVPWRAVLADLVLAGPPADWYAGLAPTPPVDAAHAVLALAAASAGPDGCTEALEAHVPAHAATLGPWLYWAGRLTVPAVRRGFVEQPRSARLTVPARGPVTVAPTLPPLPHLCVIAEHATRRRLALVVRPAALAPAAGITRTRQIVRFHGENGRLGIVVELDPTAPGLVDTWLHEAGHVLDTREDDRDHRDRERFADAVGERLGTRREGMTLDDLDELLADADAEACTDDGLAFHDHEHAAPDELPSPGLLSLIALNLDAVAEPASVAA